MYFISEIVHIAANFS